MTDHNFVIRAWQEDAIGSSSMLLKDIENNLFYAYASMSQTLRKTHLLNLVFYLDAKVFS